MKKSNLVLIISLAWCAVAGVYASLNDVSIATAIIIGIPAYLMGVSRGITTDEGEVQ